ncbi:hypothetical protein CERSUDRAFT_78293 [Gelatoporia subvermispora B]|uniref:DUF6570 domain-containing protein n=1 Tax=Ceriporiopsis subvermispora (strain B) TaxID=914234 RepID=M2Q337_CERS8|nr:hypothetical protein CERSUDRAFT_78293 [Gelatoporia subvermispora B]
MEDAGNGGRPLNEFLKLPSEDEVKNCYRAFHTATSNDALKMAVCGVCARELSVHDDQVKPHPLSLLPNAARLVPSTPHPAHTLFGGKLLEPRGVTIKGDAEMVNVCNECMSALRKKGTGPPKLSLANNLWIGQVPWQLQILTIPEQMLIALLYPRVYVFKLFPKNVGGGRNTDTLQRAMRGNVSTYELDIQGIASMVQGHLMPRPPALLVSILSVTFIGLGELPRHWLKSTFRVRRQAVFNALRWLQENNQRYYGNIEIDPERVKNLPEDDIPVEILQVIRQTEDTGIAVKESEGYVPSDGDASTNDGSKHDDVPGLESDLGKSDQQVREGKETSDKPTSHPSHPDVIPLQVSGSIDTDLTNLTASELMAWGMANLWTYFGSVESQNRGSLHLHMLIWLVGSPTSVEMHELLRTPEFRARVVAYINANLKAHVPGIESREDIKKIANKTDIAYSRPPHPDAPDYEAQVADFERLLVRSQQLHTCDLRRCLVPDKRGFYRCKRRAPFDLSDEDTVSETGKWKQKRKYEYLNGWMPAVLLNARCNNDAKLLTNGSDTKNCTFYILGYALKKQARHFNLSSIMAKGYVYHSERSEYLDSLQDNQRLLLFWLVHTINREQELSAPMVISYLMGWGDIYRSHRYSVVYWSSFVTSILKQFPELRRANSSSQSASNGQVDDNSTSVTAGDQPVDQCNDSGSENDGSHDKVSLDTDNAGRIYPKCQLTDYALRGEQLGDMNVYSFFMDTYEEDLRSKQKESVSVDDEALTDMSRKPGRRRNERVPYLSQHPCSQTKQRVMRTKGHNNLPNFVGSQFLRNDDPGTYSLYCASMLVLLKPWRNLETDLKAVDESWSTAFETFLAGAPKRIRDIPPGIQYFHECRVAAEQSPEEQPSTGVRQPYTAHTMEEPVDLGEDLPPELELHTEEGLAQLLASQGSFREEMHGRLAVEHAKRARIYSGNDVVTTSSGYRTGRNKWTTM